MDTDYVEREYWHGLFCFRITEVVVEITVRILRCNIDHWVFSKLQRYKHFLQLNRHEITPVKSVFSVDQ